MPELNLAPSPTPVVSNTANNVDPAAKSQPAQTNDGVRAEGNDDQATTPFAAILKHQMKQPDDGKAAKAVASLLATAQAGTPVATAESAAQDDALAFLAPMLAGLAPAAESGKKVSTQDEDEGDSGPVLIAAATPIDIVAQNTQTNSTSVEFTQTASTTDTSARSAANLAAQTALATENAATSGKSHGAARENFDSLLMVSREASAAAANNSAATHANSQATAVQSPTTTPVATPVGAQGWDNEVGQKIVWMANRQESRAEFVLNPPHLGRIEVSLSMNGDQANASFVSANPAVREALENAVPRLREIMQDAGISLGQAQVGAESFQQSANNKENSDNRARNGGDTRDTGVAARAGIVDGNGKSAQWVRSGNGLVDTFA